jgi:hypothetical protein
MAANGGMSFSNNFVVKFINPPAGLTYIPGGTAGVSGTSDYFEMFCSEAQLPNTNTMQGQSNGIYVGSGSVNYPHTRIFTDIQLGFMCDANMTALKYLQDWVDLIFSGGDNKEIGENVTAQTLGQMQSKAFDRGREENRNIRLKYRDDYACRIAITKTEIGPNESTERASITYILEEAYPYAIDAIPLQFGSSQITQVTAQFSYMRHYVIKNDISNNSLFTPSKLKQALPGSILV